MNAVVFKVELAELGALVEAIHLTDLIIMEVDLDQVLQTGQRVAKIVQEIILEVEDFQVGTLAEQNRD